MKKVILSLFAVAALASCVQTEELGVANNMEAIAFDNAFVDNATKSIDPSITNDSITSFKVYGTTKSLDNGAGTEVNIFNGVEVEKNGTGAWSYSNDHIQYWIADNEYKFAAVVNGTVSTDTVGLPATIEYTADGATDLLYAESETVGKASNNPAVKFTFNHLLAKAKFTVHNTIATNTADNEVTYRVSDVKINAYASATYNVENAAWDLQDGTFETAFGHIDNPVTEGALLAVDSTVAVKGGHKADSHDARLLIPGAYDELNITCKIETLLNGKVVDVVNYNNNVNITLAKGTSYNFVLSLGNPGDVVEFDVKKVEGWLPDVDLPVYGGAVYVSNTAELKAAVESDQVATIVLQNDINLADHTRAVADVTLTVKSGKELTLDLNGKTLSATLAPADASDSMFDVLGTLNVKNGEVVITREDAAFNSSYRTCVFCASFGGVVNLDGVTAKNNGGAGMAYVVDMSNSDNATVNVNNSTLETTYIAVRVFNNTTKLHNVTIKNSTLKGKFCFWVQYGLEDGRDMETLKQSVKVDIYGNGNTFEYTGKAPVLYGFNNIIYEAVVKSEEELNAAIDAVNHVAIDGDVVLEEVVTIDAGQSVVLNLYGHTISSVKACSQDDQVMILNNGELTITGNGKISLKDTSAGDPSFGWGSYTIRNNGTLVVEDGVIEHVGEQAFATHMICAIFQYSGSTTIHGGVISTPNYRSARLWMGDMTINGGTFKGQLWVQAADNTAKLTINGGNFAPSTGDGSSVFVTNADKSVKLAVNGGYFNTKIGASDATKEGVKGAIKGGIFTEAAKNNTNAALLAAGYGFVDPDGDNLWTIIPLPQQNNQIWYTATALVHAHFYKDKFGEGTDLVSNVWDETTGKGVITLSGDVTKIGQNAFYYDGFHDSRENLISISLPNTVTEIGEDAFDQCPNLTTVTFNNNLVTIGPGAFGGCTKLTNVVLPESLVTIGDNAFDSCVAIKNITIPAGVTSIGMSAFAGIKEIKVYCKPTIPPTVGYQPFNKWWAEIYVPTASLAAYQQAWGSVVDNIYDGNF